MTSKFENCKSTGHLEKVSAGEVCSLEVARTMGIDDIIHNKHYKRPYSNVKTWNTQIDTLENRTSYQLCAPNKDETIAYPLCPLQTGAGIGFTEEYVGSIDDYACITSECPTEFTQYKNKDGDPDQLKCKKPKKSKTTLLGSQNQERWYDWFTISDYHLGNGFSTSNSGHYRPCEEGSVPHYMTDPVDGITTGFNTGSDRLDRCVAKEDYFGGKYADAPSYCPIAWVFRAGATKTDYVDMYEDILDTFAATGKPTTGFDKLRESIPSLVEKEICIPIQKKGYPTFIAPPVMEQDEVACNTLARDVKRVNNAYNICKKLQDNENAFRDTLLTDVTEFARGKQVTAAIIDGKVNARLERTRQACHATFCDPNGPAMAQVEGGAPICYPEVEKANQEEMIKAAEEAEKAANKPLPPITSNKNKETTKQTATKGILEMMKTLLFIIALVIFYYRVWPFLKKIYITQIKPYFSRHAQSAEVLEAESIARDAIDLGSKKPAVSVPNAIPSNVPTMKSVIQKVKARKP